jgi:hypothetical protein
MVGRSRDPERSDASIGCPELDSSEVGGNAAEPHQRSLRALSGLPRSAACSADRLDGHRAGVLQPGAELDLDDLHPAEPSAVPSVHHPAPSSEVWADRAAAGRDPCAAGRPDLPRPDP